MDAFKKGKIFISSFAIGGLIGGLFGLLMAPKSGTETRDLIRNKSTELRDRIGDNVESTRLQAERKFENVTQQTKDKAAKLKKVGEKMISQQKRSLDKGVVDAQKVIQA
jgi:gas vesicle protein